MVRNVISLLLMVTLYLGATSEENAYERNCIPCHRYQPASLEKLFMEYLKTYSGEFSLKESLKIFLRNPTEEASLMNDKFIENFSVKDPTDLNDTELDEAIDIYWELYDVRGKLE